MNAKMLNYWCGEKTRKRKMMTVLLIIASVCLLTALGMKLIRQQKPQDGYKQHWFPD